MTPRKILSIVLFILISTFYANGQERSTPKKIKIKGDYLHELTNTFFPKQFEYLKLKDIYSFNKENSNIGVTYENIQNYKTTTLTIYLYPAGDGVEGRLRNEYLKSMQSVANVNNGIHATQFAVKHEGEEYICNGFKAIFKGSNEYSSLTLFECGTWFLKIRLTSNSLDSSQILSIERKVLDKYDPSKLTSLHPLNPKADVYFSKAAFRDSTLLGSVMGSAYRKIGWVMDNVSEKERASGFPDLYLNMHIESFIEFVKFEKRNFSKSDFTREYLAELNSIINAGYLEEYIMEQNSMVMIVPDNIIFDFEGYYKWRETKTLKINLDEKMCIVSFGQK